MPKFPEPPSADELAELEPDLATLQAGVKLVRIYSRGGDYPSHWDDFRFYGPVNARFDHHPEPPHLHTDHAILYAAHSGGSDAYITALAEVFQETRTIHARRETPALVVFEPARDLTLLNLRQAWPTRAGASMKINSGSRPRARRWSQVFYAAYPAIDGIYYRSSMHASEPSLALYERAGDALPDTPSFDRPLSDPLLTGDLKRAAERLGYDLVLGE